MSTIGAMWHWGQTDWGLFLLQILALTLVRKERLLLVNPSKLEICCFSSPFIVIKLKNRVCSSTIQAIISKAHSDRPVDHTRPRPSHIWHAQKIPMMWTPNQAHFRSIRMGVKLRLDEKDPKYIAGGRSGSLLGAVKSAYAPVRVEGASSHDLNLAGDL